jgi:hypothetical protein
MKTMNIRAKVFVCSELVLLFCACASGQQGILNNSGTAPTYVSNQVRLKDSHRVSIAKLPAGPVCANPPLASDLRPFGHFAQMSVEDAASLNLQFGGFGLSVEGSKKFQAVVWRQGRTYVCSSTDGKYNVVYGSEWDSAIAISQTSLTAKASFATIAANVQINNSSTSYDYVAAGYATTSDWETANGKLLQDISTDGLSVTNYATFYSDFGKTLTAASAMQPADPPKVIGYAPIGTTDLSQSLAKGYAVMFIAKGRGCRDAEADFPSKEPWVGPTMRGVYLQLSNGKSDCDAKADPNERAIATQLLSGIDIEKP